MARVLFLLSSNRVTLDKRSNVSQLQFTEIFTLWLLNLIDISLQVLTSQQKILELDLSNLLSSCDFTENVLRYGNEAEIMLVKPQMVSRLQNLNEHESQCEPEDNEVILVKCWPYGFAVFVVISQRVLNSSSKSYKSSNLV